MFFAPRFSRHERAVLCRLQLLGIEGTRTVTPRTRFRDDLRARLVTEASCESGCGEQQRALAMC